MAGALELQSLGKRFGRLEALRGIDLEVGADELLVVLGPTGAGKTTLLRAIAGLEEVDEGRIIFQGEDIGHAAPAGRDMAFVFQNFSLYPDWSVRRNMEFPLRAPGRDMVPSAIAERVEWAASLLQIDALLERPAVQLSGGEMQRVAIGRAIVRQPRLFLLDEPLTNLDAKLRQTLRLELVVLRRNLGIPMIYVTHDQAEALSMGDRIAVLAQGRLLQVGTPEEVYLNPASPVVARQLGQPAINILAVRWQNGTWVSDAGVAIMPAVQGEAAMLLGVRPEDIAPLGGRRAGTIQVVEDTGPTWILLVDWAGVQIHIVTAKDRTWRPGDEIYPLVDARRAILWRADHDQIL